MWKFPRMRSPHPTSLAGDPGACSLLTRHPLGTPPVLSRMQTLWQGQGS